MDRVGEWGKNGTRKSEERKGGREENEEEKEGGEERKEEGKEEGREGEAN